MKKIILSLFCILSIGIIYIMFSSKTTYLNYIQILSEDDNTVYIPTPCDLLYYEEPKPEHIKLEGYCRQAANVENMDVIEAIYKLKELSIEEIDKLLYSPFPNLRVYGYIYYVRKTQDIHFDYLLESFENVDMIYYVDQDKWIYSECYVSDVLLLIALKGVDYPKLLPKYWSFGYGLTEKQKEILKTAYEKKGIIDRDMDILIRHAFVSDEMY